MNYGQDCDKFSSRMGCLLFCLAVVFLTYYCLRMLQKLDKEAECIKQQKKGVSPVLQLCVCVLNSEAVFLFGEIWMFGTDIFPVNNMIWYVMLFAILAGCLTAACIMDVESCMIYDYVWWLGMIAGVLLLCIGKCDRIMELLLFILLQELFFCRFYGRADCHAFAVCAITETAMGIGMKGYLIHMLVAFSMLALIQGMCHTINNKGNLKQPIPFLPYITGSFWILMCLNSILQKIFPAYLYKLC